MISRDSDDYYDCDCDYDCDWADQARSLIADAFACIRRRARAGPICLPNGPNPTSERVWGNGSSMRCDISLLFTLGLGLTADLLTAGCCTDFRPRGFSTTSIKDSDALSLRRSPDSVGAESLMSPLSTWMWKTATSSSSTRMRRTTLAKKSCSVFQQVWALRLGFRLLRGQPASSTLGSGQVEVNTVKAKARVEWKEESTSSNRK